ncbi:MAG: DMT family transporter [Pirellulales bacterium]
MSQRETPNSPATPAQIETESQVVTAVTTNPSALWKGVCWGLLSAVGYSAANVFLKMSERDGLAPVWVSFVKAIPTVAIYAPLVLWQLNSGKITYPTRKAFIILAIASVTGHLFGNVAFQWSLGIVGVAMSVPLCLGMLILGGAVLGRMFLHERISRQSGVSILVLILAIVVLSFGAGEANQAVQTSKQPGTPWIVLGGVICACLAGLSYAALGAAIRYGVAGKTSVMMTLVIVCGTGMLALGPLCLLTPGISEMQQTKLPQLGTMLMAGVWNAVAFYALTRALKMTNVTFVNSLNASQTAMAALAGILFFAEPMTFPLGAGLLLTIVGLLIMRRDHAEDHQVEEHIGETG